MSDVKVQQKQELSRQEAARFIAALADGLGDDGTVTVRLGSSTVEFLVASQVDCELEVSVDGDEIELELELKWSTSGRSSTAAAREESLPDELHEDASDSGESEDGESEEALSEEIQSERAEAEEDAAGESPSEEDAGAEEVAVEAPSQEVGRPDDAGSGPAAPPKQTAQARRGRRKAGAAPGKPAFNGVDTAAVRAWAAANGMNVSPRGRIRDEVIEAYRAAGN